MTECNGCGSCCDPVWLPYSQADARHYDMHPESKRWTLEDLEPMSDVEVKAKEPDFYQRLHELWRNKLIEGLFFYRCRNFEPFSRTCRIYDSRPPVCARYPWLLGFPVSGSPLPPTCSYRADIGETVVEIRPKPS